MPQNKPNSFRFFESRTFLFILLLFIIWGVIILARTAFYRYQIVKQNRNLAKEIEKLEKENKELQEFLKFLQTPEFKEQEARKRLNLKKEGEEVVLIPQENQNGSTTVAATSTPRTKPESNLLKWWRYLFDSVRN